MLTMKSDDNVVSGTNLVGVQTVLIQQLTFGDKLMVVVTSLGNGPFQVTTAAQNPVLGSGLIFQPGTNQGSVVQIQGEQTGDGPNATFTVTVTDPTNSANSVPYNLTVTRV